MRLILLGFLLVGCGGRINKSQIDIAESMCKQNGGLKNIWVPLWIGPLPTIYCNNSAEFYIGVIPKAYK